MSLSRALLISTFVVICVIEVVTHVACCSSPASLALGPSVSSPTDYTTEETVKGVPAPFRLANRHLDRAAARGRTAAELAALPLGSGRTPFLPWSSSFAPALCSPSLCFPSLCPPSSLPAVVTFFVPGSFHRPGFSRVIHTAELASDPRAADHWKALLQEALLQEAAAKPSSSAHTPGVAQVQDGEAEMVKWKLPHYDVWSPPLVYGPSLPPERIRVQQQAHRLLQDLRTGRLTVLYDARDGEQLRAMERDGLYSWPAPPPGISVRAPRQRAMLEGTLAVTEETLEAPAKEVIAKRVTAKNATSKKTRIDILEGTVGNDDRETKPSSSEALRLASRGTLPRRFPTVNPADDPDFDPCTNPPAPGLLRLLTTLAAHSTPERPLTLLSLLRPPYRFGEYVHVGPTNPHSLGLAVDIAAYGGHAFRQAEPEACVAATLSLLHDLPPGRYRLGLPKAPEGAQALPTYLTTRLARPTPLSDRSGSVTQGSAAAPAGRTGQERQEEPPAATGCVLAALYGLHIGEARFAWPFFPAPFTELLPGEGAAVAEASDSEDLAASTTAKAAARPFLKRVMWFANEAYASESDLNRACLRDALAAARRRGVNVIALFPDGADHLHIDVRQNP